MPLGLHHRLLAGSAFYRYPIAQQVLERRIGVGPRGGDRISRRVSEELARRGQAAGLPLVVISWSSENEPLYPGVPASRQVSIVSPPHRVLEVHPPRTRWTRSPSASTVSWPAAESSLASPAELPEGAVILLVCQALIAHGGPASALFLDNNHLSAEGKRVVGEALARGLVDRGLGT